MDIRYDFFSNLQDCSILLSEDFSMSSSSVGQSCIIKSDKFFTNRLFIFKKRTNNWQMFCKRFTTKSPADLVLLGLSAFKSINKIEKAAKTFNEPLENRSLCIVTLQKYFVSSIRSISGVMFLYPETTFGIYKACKVSIICKCWFDSISELHKFIYMRFGYKIVGAFQSLHSACKQFLCNNILRIGKPQSGQALFAFLNKIKQNFVHCFNRFILLQSKLIKSLLICMGSTRNMNASTKNTVKVIKNIFINGCYVDGCNRFMSFANALKSNIETTVSIYIASHIRVFYLCIIFILHRIILAQKCL